MQIFSLGGVIVSVTSCYNLHDVSDPIKISPICRLLNLPKTR